VKTDCWIFSGEIESNGVEAIKDVATAHPSINLFGGDGVISNALADPKTGLPPDIGARFEGTIATLDPKYFPPAGKKFFEQYKKAYHTQDPDPYAIYGYESMSLLLDSIKKAGIKNGESIADARAAVVKAIYSTKNRQSVLGTYSIDQNGDTTLTDYGLYKIANGKLAFDKVIKSQGGS